MPETTARSLYAIRAEIARNWMKPYFGAVPYLDAMASLDKMTDYYGAESAEDIVMYLLVNMRTWRGDVARRIKAELNKMLKDAR